MRKKKELLIKREELNLTTEEKEIRLLFDFAYWLQNMPGKSGLSGAIVLLRAFLEERKEKEG